MGQDPSPFRLHLHVHWLRSMDSLFCINSQKAMETLRWSNLQSSIQNWWCVNEQAQAPPLTNPHPPTKYQNAEFNYCSTGIKPWQTGFTINEIQICKGMYVMAAREELRSVGQRGSSGCSSSIHYQSVNIYSSTSLLSNHHTIDQGRIEVRERKWETRQRRRDKTINTLSLPPASHKT